MILRYNRLMELKCAPHVVCSKPPREQCRLEVGFPYQPTSFLHLSTGFVTAKNPIRSPLYHPHRRWQGQRPPTTIKIIFDDVQVHLPRKRQMADYCYYLRSFNSVFDTFVHTHVTRLFVIRSKTHTSRADKSAAS